MLDFPSSPTDGQIYGSYLYSGGVWLQNGALLTPTAQARNRVCNPAMQISQENGNTSGSTAAGYWTADQWGVTNSSGTFTATTQRVQVTTPNGSINRVRATIATGNASSGTAPFTIVQSIEGVKIADFRYGSAQAKQAILRFGWKSPAGTYSVAIKNNAGDRTFLAGFTITAGQANVDTEQIIIIPGDITGTWLNDNGVGLRLGFAISCPPSSQGVAGWQAGNFQALATQSNGGATSNNVFELFDVGLYLDPQATGVAPPWQLPDEAQELAACQRYYWKSATSRTM